MSESKAGADYKNEGGVPKSELIADLKYVGDKVGGAPTRDEYDERGLFSSRTVHTRFNSWVAGLQAAGFDVSDRDYDYGPAKYDPEELINWIISWRAEFGVWPTSGDFDDPDAPTPSLTPYVTHWGSFRKARIKAKARWEADD